MKDSRRFVQNNGHQRLWQLLAHCALQKLDFDVAESSFACFNDTHGIGFVRRLKVCSLINWSYSCQFAAVEKKKNLLTVPYFR